MPQWKLIVVGIVIIVLVIISVLLFDVVTIKGNEIGIKETWGGGVIDKTFAPKTYFLFPGFSQRMYKYDGSSQIFVMDNDADPEEIAKGTMSRAYEVQSREGQQMLISSNVLWRIDPIELVNVHKTVRQRIAEKILRPVLMRIMKDKATAREAIDAYSGTGLVALQKEIQDALTDPNGELKGRGIIVENFVIKGIQLDPEYIGEIKAKQVAVQRELRAKQEELAALAEANRVKAQAQADYNKQIVEAERDKQRGILDAEKNRETAILAAQAEKEKRILEATGLRDAELLRAEGIVAVGQADAKAIELKMKAYASPGSDQYVTMEVSRNLANGFKNVSGYLPESMKINVLSTSFLDAMKDVVGNASGQPAKAN